MRMIEVFVMMLTAASLLPISQWAVAQRAGQSMSVQHGVVTSGLPVDLQSNAVPAGAVVGGSIGLVSSGGKSLGKKARNSLIGAAAGGALGAAARGDRCEIRIGDCVAVESGRDTANIRRVSEAYCQPANHEAVAAVKEQDLQEAHECTTAKQAVIDAESDEQAELAATKMHLLCSN